MSSEVPLDITQEKDVNICPRIFYQTHAYKFIFLYFNIIRIFISWSCITFLNVFSNLNSKHCLNIWQFLIVFLVRAILFICYNCSCKFYNWTVCRQRWNSYSKIYQGIQVFIPRSQACHFMLSLYKEQSDSSGQIILTDYRNGILGNFYVLKYTNVRLFSKVQCTFD